MGPGMDRDPDWLPVLPEHGELSVGPEVVDEILLTEPTLFTGFLMKACKGSRQHFLGGIEAEHSGHGGIDLEEAAVVCADPVNSQGQVVHEGVVAFFAFA